MSEIRETVYIGRDNSIRLLLKEDNVALMTAHPTLSPSRWLLTVHAVTPIVADSAVNPELFSWNAAESVLELYLGSKVTTEIGYAVATLVMYDAQFPNGLVLLHPSTTPDRLRIRVQDDV